MPSAIQMTRRMVCMLPLAVPFAAILAPRLLAADAATVTIAYPVDIPSWDPTSVTFPSGQSIYKSVFDSPLHLTPDQTLAERQVRAWRWLDQDSRRLEVELRPGITFHDGSPLTTADLRYSLFERPAADRKLAIAGMIANLADIEIVSDTRAVLVFSTSNPAAAFYLGFLGAYILPKAYLEKVGLEGFLDKPVGAGPYKVVSYQRGSRIVLEAFDGYWGPAPQVRTVVFQIMPEPSARVAAIESGNADVAVQLPFREAVRLEGSGELTVSLYPQSEIYMLQVPSYVEAFRNDDVRRALHLAIDNGAISKGFFKDKARPLSVLATPGSSGYVDGFTFPSDPEAARQLLAKAGHDASNPLKITLWTTNGTFPNDYDIARAIAGMWRAVGVQTNLEEVALAKYFEQSHSGKLPGMMLFSWANPTGDPENWVGRVLDPRLRFAAWKDPALTDRIARIVSEPLGETRLQDYRQLARDASENSWNIPLLQTVGNVVARKPLQVPTYQAGYVLPAEFRTQ